MPQNRKHSASRRKRAARQHKGAESRALWVILAAGALLVIGAVFILLRSSNAILLRSSNSGASANFTPLVTGAPRVAVAQDTLDYGYVRLGTTINSVFQVRNVGDQPLQILGEPRVELVQGC